MCKALAPPAASLSEVKGVKGTKTARRAYRHSENGRDIEEARSVLMI